MGLGTLIFNHSLSLNAAATPFKERDWQQSSLKSWRDWERKVRSEGRRGGKRERERERETCFQRLRRRPDADDSGDLRRSRRRRGCSIHGYSFVLYFHFSVLFFSSCYYFTGSFFLWYCFRFCFVIWPIMLLILTCK